MKTAIADVMLVMTALFRVKNAHCDAFLRKIYIYLFQILYLYFQQCSKCKAG